MDTPMPISVKNHFGAQTFVQVVGNTIQCPFHGWSFDGSGTCFLAVDGDGWRWVGVNEREHSVFSHVFEVFQTNHGPFCGPWFISSVLEKKTHGPFEIHWASRGQRIPYTTRLTEDVKEGVSHGAQVFLWICQRRKGNWHDFSILNYYADIKKTGSFYQHGDSAWFKTVNHCESSQKGAKLGRLTQKKLTNKRWGLKQHDAEFSNHEIVM